jgi:hypothetical protein
MPFGAYEVNLKAQVFDLGLDGALMGLIGGLAERELG